jgi:phosphate transport system permease protein
MANLPVTINNFINNPDPNWTRLAWAGALLITLAVLSLNIVARSLSGGRNPK